MFPDIILKKTSQKVFCHTEVWKDDSYIQEWMNDFNKAKELENCRKDINTFKGSSGNVSFADIFLYKESREVPILKIDGPMVISKKHTQGILLYVSRYYPIAVFGKFTLEQRQYLKGAGENSRSLSIEDIELSPGGDWQKEIHYIESYFKDHFIEVLSKTEAKKRLDFPLPFYNLLSCGSDESLIDAFFFWED